jgi:hypothetical protein
MWRYTELGMYGAQLGRFLQRFPRERILVLLHARSRACHA